MKPEGNFVAEAIAAQHARELLRAIAPGSDPLKDLNRLAGRVGELLGDPLARLCAGRKIALCASPAVEVDGGSELAAKLGSVAANCILAAGEGQAPLMVSIPAATALAFVDLIYGGTGEVPERIPEKLPATVSLMSSRLEAIVVEALAAALELGAGKPGDDKPDENKGIRTLCSGTDEHLLVPFAQCRVMLFSVEIAVAGIRPLAVTVGFPAASITELFGKRAPGKPASVRNPKRASPAVEPFAGIPLPLKAVLVDMNISVSLLSALKPGMILPVAVARTVPLIAGEQVVAQGTIGAMDDRAALQLTQITSRKEK